MTAQAIAQLAPWGRGGLALRSCASGKRAVTSAPVTDASFDSYSDGYHSGGGYDGSDEYSSEGYSSYSDYRSGYGGGRARVGDLSPPPGVQPCDNCSLVFPDGGSTTIFQGSASSKDCVCAPGGSHHCTAQQPPCLLSNRKLWTPSKAP